VDDKTIGLVAELEGKIELLLSRLREMCETLRKDFADVNATITRIDASMEKLNQLCRQRTEGRRD